MGTFGGLAPFPRRFGGAPRRISTILKSLQKQLAPKYDVFDTNGIVYVRLNALARVIAGGWSQNARLANQWDPARMTDFLERWEAIFGLSPATTDSMTVRRARVGARIALAGFGTLAAVYTLCQMMLEDVFVSVVHTDVSQALVWTPAGWPMGNHASMPANPGPDWFSTISNLAILTQQPSTMDDAEYYAKRASVLPELDDILPAWVTFDVVRDGAHGIGFYLDDDHNLDNERFD
jgi:hypothetical protein